MTEQEFALRAQDQRGRLYRTAFLLSLIHILSLRGCRWGPAGFQD